MPTGPKGQKHAWLLQGYDGLNPIFCRRLSGALSEKEISVLLTRLAAQHLTSGEIISASVRRSMKGYLPLLEIRKEPRERMILSVGENPHYVASVHTEYEFADMKATLCL